LRPARTPCRAFAQLSITWGAPTAIVPGVDIHCYLR
jgi:hypothetical protein